MLSSTSAAGSSLGHSVFCLPKHDPDSISGMQGAALAGGERGTKLPGSAGWPVSDTARLQRAVGQFAT